MKLAFLVVSLCELCGLFLFLICVLCIFDRLISDFVSVYDLAFSAVFDMRELSLCFCG